MLKIAKIAKNSTKNRPYGPAGAAGAEIFGPKEVLSTSQSAPEKVLEICDFHVSQVVPFAGTLC